ncbi:hypothetical protein DXG01_010844, partial [Tephrocybe rancida]
MGGGMRVVREQSDFQSAFERAVSEAKSAFGDGTLFIERFLKCPRHIEVQLLADAQGNTIHLFEHDCSVQRRHQKVVEVAPVTHLPKEVRQAIFGDAIKLAKKEIIGIDIVAAQIQIAAGTTLPQLGLTQDAIAKCDFAIQCHITTEDAAQGFQPDTGKIEVYRSAGGNGVRLDASSGFAGAQITPYYDSLLVKCTVQGTSYEVARRKMLRALVEFHTRGVKTNIPFLFRLLTHDILIGGKTFTTFIDNTPDLFKLVQTQNRAQKLLGYLGDLAVNGSSIKGQTGEPGLKTDIVVPKLQSREDPVNGPPHDPYQPCTVGWRNSIVEQCPEAFAKAVRDYPGCLIMDTTWRDAHQSLLATRLRTIDMLNIAKETSYALANAYSLESGVAQPSMSPCTSFMKILGN